MKKENMMIDYTEDFGFSVVSEEELNNSKKIESETLHKNTVKHYEQKIKDIHKMIIPLLNNLKENPTKEYIYWPNRVEKIDSFIKKMEKLMFN